MAHFNFQNLSPEEFEALAQDVMQRVLDVLLFRYGPGPDGGIDLCDNLSTHNIIVQCKRYGQNQFQNLLQILKDEKKKLDSLIPPPNEYYVFTSLALNIKQKQQVYDLFKNYMKSEANIIDQIAIEDFFNREQNHDLIPKHIRLFVSFPENYVPTKNEKEAFTKRKGRIKEQLIQIADRKKNQIHKDLLFPWFADSAQYYEVFPKLFIDPTFTINKPRKEILSIPSLFHNNLMILGEAGAGKTTFLKNWFSYKEKEKMAAKDTVLLFFNANSFLETESELIAALELAENDPDSHYLFLIDGIDEAFYNDHYNYRLFVARLKVGANCNYWLGCRKDFYENHIDERTKISDFDLTIEKWDSERIDFFIKIYSEIRHCPNLPEMIESIIEKSPDPNGIDQMRRYPFQLSILTFLAEEYLKKEDGIEGRNTVHGVYDLYEQFIHYWVRHEKNRGTSPSSEDQIIVALRIAARHIYTNENYIFDEVAENNTAVKGLLRIKQIRIEGKSVSNEFYHRSIAEFLLANDTFQSIYDNDGGRFRSICQIKLKDDITNYICDKFSALSVNERLRIKRNLWKMYRASANELESLSVKEQIIYFITRLEVDVSDFIQEIIPSAKAITMLRMTLAYGCALQEDTDTRRYALEFARSIAEHPQGEEAVVNRAWAVIYYGDIHSEDLEMDEYLYRDTQKGPWEKVRKSRIDRFIRTLPRRKDIRFLILDIPLFHNFLIDRNWDNISLSEYRILSAIPVENALYSQEERRFLESEKAKLLQDYRNQLSQQNHTICFESL